MRKYSEDKISVIIPCYNVESYIDRCLESVVNQTIGLDQLEIICVNDASTDRTWDRLSEWEKRYVENILLVDCEKNGKLGRARNIGLSYATGNFIVFLDSDDWLELDAYEKMYRIMQEFACDIVRCQMIRDPGENNIWEKCRKRSGKDFILEISGRTERQKFLVSDIMDNGCCNKMYTRDFIFQNQLRFPEGRAYEDIYWGMLAQFYAEKIYFLNENMYHYFINPNSIVLRKDEPYHMDIFHTSMQMWEECKRRGIVQEYPKEMELNFLIYYYLGGIKMLALRYTDLRYEEFQKMCETVQRTVPDYKNNPYLSEILDAIKQLQIELIDKDITREEFAQVVSILQGKKG